MPPPAIDIKALRKNYDVQGGGAYEVSSIASKSCDVLNNTSSSKNLSLDSRSDRQGGFRRSPFGTCRSNARADLMSASEKGPTLPERPGWAPKRRHQVEPNVRLRDRSIASVMTYLRRHRP
jgi:hypothetical protein